jgi:ParB/RepB/Spo0J family partition protein
MSNDLPTLLEGAPSNSARRPVFIDAASVRPDGINPRDFAKLDEASCGELMSMIKAVGQLAPVLVRPAAGDQSYKYQLIYGARRLWSVLELNREGVPIQLLAEIDDIDDRQAAHKAEAENRGRAGISAYERGVFLKDQLKHYQNDKALAAAYDLDSALVSRLLALADWPSDLLLAFGDQRQVTVEDVAVLASHLKEHRNAVLAQARTIAEEQAKKAAGSMAYVRRTDVRARLVAAVNPQSLPKRILDDYEQPLLTIAKRSRNGASLRLFDEDQTRRERTIEAMVKAAKSVRHGAKR